MEDFSLSGVVKGSRDRTEKAGLVGVGQFTVWGQSSQGGTRGDLCSEAEKGTGLSSSLDGESSVENDARAIEGV